MDDALLAAIIMRPPGLRVPELFAGAISRRGNDAGASRTRMNFDRQVIDCHTDSVKSALARNNAFPARREATYKRAFHLNLLFQDQILSSKTGLWRVREFTDL